MVPNLRACDLAMAISTYLQQIAHRLSVAGVRYHVVEAGRTESPVRGREYFSGVNIKVNSKNQAGVAWSALLRKLGIKNAPYFYKAAWEGGIFKYRYVNSAQTVWMFTQFRPDMDNHGFPAGHAGDVVLMVTDASSIKFGAARSALALAARTGVPRKWTKRTREQAAMEAGLMHGLHMNESSDPNIDPDNTVVPEPSESLNDREQTLHALTMKSIMDSGIGNKKNMSMSEYAEMYLRHKEQIQDKQ